MSRNALTLKQQRELHSQVLRGVPTDLTIEVYDYWGAHGSELNNVLREALSRVPSVLAETRLLELVTTVELPAIENFSVQDHFKLAEVGGVKIGYLGENFNIAFLSGEGKEEKDVPTATLRVHKLLKSKRDGLIIDELDGEGVAETTLGQMFEMMKAQGHGQEGNLLINGYANIFYIRDAKGEFWAVRCYWDAGFSGWGVEAYPITLPYEWYHGRQVVSR